MIVEESDQWLVFISAQLFFFNQLKKDFTYLLFETIYWPNFGGIIKCLEYFKARFNKFMQRSGFELSPRVCNSTNYSPQNLRRKLLQEKLLCR